MTASIGHGGAADAMTRADAPDVVNTMIALELLLRAARDAPIATANGGITGNGN